ncbi:MAG TPA: hypothetical protein VHC23_02080, partial [Jatrophihabitans sp.]|nr:hypothetical protein [Jatrophihabitans sp.]
WGALHDDLHQLSTRGDWAAMGALIDDEVLAAFAVVAEPERLAAAIAARVGGLADRTSLLIPIEVSEEQEAAWVRTLQAAPSRTA